MPIVRITAAHSNAANRIRRYSDNTPPTLRNPRIHSTVRIASTMKRSVTPFTPLGYVVSGCEYPRFVIPAVSTEVCHPSLSGISFPQRVGTLSSRPRAGE